MIGVIYMKMIGNTGTRTTNLGESGVWCIDSERSIAPYTGSVLPKALSPGDVGNRANRRQVVVPSFNVHGTDGIPRNLRGGWEQWRGYYRPHKFIPGGGVYCC